MSYEIKVLSITGTSKFLIKKEELSHQETYLLNNDNFKPDRDSNYIIDKIDKLEIVPRKGNLSIVPRKGNLSHFYRDSDSKKLSIEDYRSKNQYYDEESSEDKILDAIKNRKDLSGFNPVYSKVQSILITYKVTGYITETKSKFIRCEVSPYSLPTSTVFTVFGREIAINEYNILSEKYKSHASFEKVGINNLRYLRINNDFAFYDGKPFNDHHYRSTFTSLENAQVEEDKIRTLVSSAVIKAVFPFEYTKNKSLRILSQLELIREMSTKKQMCESLDFLINDLRDYTTIR